MQGSYCRSSHTYMRQKIRKKKSLLKSSENYCLETVIDEIQTKTLSTIKSGEKNKSTAVCASKHK